MKSALWILHFILLIASSSILAQVNDQPYNKDEGNITYRISGGSIKESEKYARFMVSLRSRYYYVWFGENHFCGGIIISSSWVLTAATCVSDKRKVPIRPRRMMIVAGTPNRLHQIETTLEFLVTSIHIHPNFAHKGPFNAALVRIAGEFPTHNPGIEIMPLPTTPPPYDTDCLVLGWGRMYLKGPVAASLMHTTLTLMAEAKCKSEVVWYKPGVLCAIDKTQSARDVCPGDSGGPLICNDQLVGIVSFTKNCDETQGPSIFTSVYHSLDFIKEAMNAANRYRFSLLLLVLSTVEV